ncbi:111_t:CDS:2 [Gigaspora margarita]|uniref:111_t:CDS:1 n=1 Tax=Gigaspora margarita TaxID=4874 RepID=A0ABN7VZT8_GIGMA|nr:111_t:CDS:2 [Gigaspora margarita]
MYLQVSVGNLHAVQEKIFLVLENQYQEIKTMTFQKIIQILYAQNNSFYTQVVTKWIQQLQLSQEESSGTDDSLQQK